MAREPRLSLSIIVKREGFTVNTAEETQVIWKITDGVSFGLETVSQWGIAQHVTLLEHLN